MANRKIFTATIAWLSIAIIALVMLNFSSIGKKKTWDVEMPMANANVSWEQTYFPGGFNKGDGSNEAWKPF